MYDTAATTSSSYVGGNSGYSDYNSSTSSLSQSCGMEALVIQRPQSEVSLSWSDFPTVKEDYKYTHEHESSSSLCSLTSSSSSGSSSSSSNSLSEFSSTSSRMNLLDGNPSTTDLSSTTTREDLSSQRNVRFSQHLKVRTYNLVLGDHPLCSNGLAIEHGWEYDSHHGEKIDMQLHEGASTWSSSSRHLRNNISCPRRSHLDKKRLLLEVAGCSEDELNERTNTYQEECLQREAER